MKYLPLLWNGLRRRPVRTTLIVLQVAVALGLFAVLQGIESGARALIAHTVGIAAAVSGTRQPVAQALQGR